MPDPNVQMSLEDAVAEVLGILTGMDLQYIPEYDRFYAITRCLNRAMRSMALEHEWSWYADTEDVATAVEGNRSVTLDATVRPRIIGDDAVRLIDPDDDDAVVRWAYFLPRDALHKYEHQHGLWCAALRQSLMFSRPFTSGEDGLHIIVPVMREPIMFDLPPQPENNGDPTPVPAPTLAQLLDFQYPDVVILRAAFYYAQTDPVMQPRVQTIEAQYKDLMYQIIERDDRNTESPYTNEFVLPLQSGIEPEVTLNHLHPHSNFGW
jgi:hypothetical protein